MKNLQFLFILSFFLFFYFNPFNTYPLFNYRRIVRRQKKKVAFGRFSEEIYKQLGRCRITFSFFLLLRFLVAVDDDDDIDATEFISRSDSGRCRGRKMGTFFRFQEKISRHECKK